MSQYTESIQSLLEPWLLFLADDPMLRLMQGIMLLVGALVIFLVFFTTRDILLRTNSFFYMFICIVLVAVLPLVGFLLYILIRPARTIKERELYKMIASLKKAEKSSVSPKAKQKTVKSKKVK